MARIHKNTKELLTLIIVVNGALSGLLRLNFCTYFTLTLRLAVR
jgi:hypothetical protein